MKKTEYVIILDQSASTFPQREWVADRLEAFWQKLVKAGEEKRIPFFLIHQRVTAWTLCVDPAKDRNPFEGMVSSYGTTPLYDTICRAVEVIGRKGRFDPKAHTMLLILSDGKDHGSEHTKKDADDALRYARSLGWEVRFLWPAQE